MPVPEFRIWDGEEMIYASDSAVWSLKIEAPTEWALYYKTRLHCRKSSETDLMQYVGMEDFDGEQIFGKDILRDETGTLGLVWWNSEKGRYDLLSPDGDTVVLSRATIRRGSWRIVGNLHEDPHIVDPDLSRLLRHLKGQTDDVECPVCGGTDFEADPTLVLQGAAAQQQQSLFAVHCTRCHHVLLFHMEAVE